MEEEDLVVDRLVGAVNRLEVVDRLEEGIKRKEMDEVIQMVEK